MPLVVVTRNPKIVAGEKLAGLAEVLQLAVSRYLRVRDDGGDLSPAEIEVRFREPGPHDVNFVSLQIEVFANWFPSRAKNIELRTIRIAEDVKDSGVLPIEIFTGKDAFVWVMLGHAGFHMF